MSLGLPYHLVKTYNASNFLNEFSYFNWPDPTHGDVNYVDRDTAFASSLSYVNDAGNVVLKVDNNSFVPDGQKRDSVRVSSMDSYGLGTLWVLDAYHAPYGCSVWGAYWSVGVDAGWPNGGEIDIFEGVNMQNSNQMTIHSDPGCTMPHDLSQTGAQTGTALGTDCASSPSNNAGCGVMERTTNSYGKAFADNKGGVWVTQFDTSGIRLWFVPRSQVPLEGVPPDPSKLGTPSAFFSPSNCDLATFFTKQMIIFDITLCGDWAGNAMGGACPVPGGQSCYSTYVVRDGHNLDQAYFEIASLKIYAANSGREPAPECTSTYSPRVAGETCDTIGTAFGLSAGQILEANPGLNCEDTPTNTDICIPPSGSSSTSTSSPPPTSTSSLSTTSSTNSSPTPSCFSTYVSVPGDTCEKLDKTYNLLGGTIKQANQFVDCSNIWTWTPICIPDGPYNAPPCKSTHESVTGDTCESIETKYNLVEGTIKTANNFISCTDVWAHTPICVPDGPYKQTKCKTTYPSIAGDTCATIDNEFNLIDGTTKATNSFLTCSDIWTGTPICIPDGPYKTSYEPNCITQTYKSLVGETCSSIETKFALAAGSVSRANAWVNCADIWTGTNLSICVPTLSNNDPKSCTKTISSNAGDTCASIAQSYGTSAAWIKAWNSFLNCADIWAHTTVCASHT